MSAIYSKSAAIDPDTRFVLAFTPTRHQTAALHKRSPPTAMDCFVMVSLYDEMTIFVEKGNVYT
jgi:hypothetical protein